MKVRLSVIYWIVILSILAAGCSSKTPDRIAFVSDRNGTADIYSIDPDEVIEGAGTICLLRMTGEGTHDTSPVWSPDGKYIAYQLQPVTSDKESYIYVMGSDGSSQEKLTNNDNLNFQIEPRWSPDGKQIVFASLNDDGTNDLYEAMVATHELIALDDRPDNQEVATYANTSTRSWSPDGKTILYMGVEGDNYQILSIPAGGGKVTLLTSDVYDHYDPSWSPDGSQIMYFRLDYQSNPPNIDIYVMNADGSNSHAINSDPGYDYSTVWSPDGKKIAFVSERDGNQEIYVVDADGQNLTRLTNDPANDNSPTWSPDGQKLAFVSDRDGNEEIYVINLRNLQLTRLTNDPGADYSPAWSPAGANPLAVSCP
jgi:Tol biopolymer transport system component